MSELEIAGLDNPKYQYLCISENPNPDGYGWVSQMPSLNYYTGQGWRVIDSWQKGISNERWFLLEREIYEETT